MFKNRTQNIECSFGCVARSAFLLKPNVANILFFKFCEQKFVKHSPITKKNYPIMPLDRNPHKTVTRFGCVGFSLYACKFSVLLMRQFCLFTYPPRSKWASSEKMIFFLPKSAFSVSRSFPALFKRIHNHIRSADG